MTTKANRIAHINAQCKVIEMQAADLIADLPYIKALAAHAQSIIRVGEGEAMDDQETLDTLKTTLDRLKTRLARHKVLSDSIQGCEYRLFSEDAK